jgi:hypothetical protein
MTYSLDIGATMMPNASGHNWPARSKYWQKFPGAVVTGAEPLVVDGNAR